MTGRLGWHGAGVGFCSAARAASSAALSCRLFCCAPELKYQLETQRCLRKGLIWPNSCILSVVKRKERSVPTTQPFVCTAVCKQTRNYFARCALPPLQPRRSDNAVPGSVCGSFLCYLFHSSCCRAVSPLGTWMGNKAAPTAAEVFFFFSFSSFLSPHL